MSNTTQTDIIIESVRIKRIPDECADTSYLEQDEFTERLAEYRNGQFGFIGIMAEATVSYSIGGTSRRLETFTSGGLWGIEDDAEEYLKEVENDELANLAEHLGHFGIETTTEELKELASHE